MMREDYRDFEELYRKKADFDTAPDMKGETKELQGVLRGELQGELRGETQEKPLDPAQKKACRHFLGPCMVIAGPGSGKTTVLTHRIDTLVQKYGVPPERILVITFTRAAAEEMKLRYLRLSGSAGEKVLFGTFHSVFFRILKAQYHYDSTQILREAEKRRLLTEVLTEMFPEETLDSETVNALLRTFSARKNRERQEESEGSDEIFRRYEEVKKSLGRIDFDDMLTETFELLKKDRKARNYWQKQFRFILVDEFQDINPLQYRIVRMLAEPENNLFIVGDDDQSIYGFRGADPKIMLRFPKDYRDAACIFLNLNYRSGEAIVRASSSLIEEGSSRFRKKLRAAEAEGRPSRHSCLGDSTESGRGENTESGGSGPFPPVLIRSFRNSEEEAESIAAGILTLLRNGFLCSDIAILLRTNNGAALFAAVLSGEGIPYYSAEKMPNLFREGFMDPVYAMLNWASGNRSLKNLLRFMNCPSRGISRKVAEETGGDPERIAAEYRKMPDRASVGAKAALLASQLSLLERLGYPFAMINYIRKGMGYDRFLQSAAARKYRTDPGEMLSRLDEVQASAASSRTVAEWYAFIAEYTEKNDRTAAEPGNRVRIGTIHGAKGLEFGAVFLPSVNERVIPHEKALTGEALEEERRILYVGMTRAIRLLRLSWVRERFGRQAEISRFLQRFPQSPT